MEKTYSILIQFGDGKPVASKIRAKNGIDAQDKALALNPGAFSIRVTGVLKVRPSPPVIKKPVKKKVDPLQLFTDISPQEVQTIVQQAQEEQLL